MWTPEEQGMQIILSKTNFDEIEKGLKEIDQQFHQTEDLEHQQLVEVVNKDFKIAKSLYSELVTLNEKKKEVIAKRINVKQRSDEAKAFAAKAVNQRAHLNELLQEEAKTQESLRREQYEVSMNQIANTFMDCYDLEAIDEKIENANELVIKLEKETELAEAEVAMLRRQYEELSEVVPEDILDTLGKSELEKKLQEVTHKVEELQKKIAE